jgi:hypothetical protein
LGDTGVVKYLPVKFANSIICLAAYIISSGTPLSQERRFEKEFRAKKTIFIKKQGIFDLRFCKQAYYEAEMFQ